MASVVARGVRLCFVNSWRINHLGKKPVRGGRPPNDRRINGVKAAMAGAFVQAEDKELIVLESVILTIRNIAVVIII